MKKLVALAAFLLASTAAQAQYSFEYGGRTIRIDPDRGTVSIPGVYDNTGRRPKRSQDSDRQRKQMTTLRGNIRTIAIDGKFDDCQGLAKRAFADPALAHMALSSAN